MRWYSFQQLVKLPSTTIRQISHRPPQALVNKALLMHNPYKVLKPFLRNDSKCC